MLKQFIVVCLILTLPLVSYAATIQLPRTGQTTCYDTLGAEISCSGTGQDGHPQLRVALEAIPGGKEAAARTIERVRSEITHSH